MFINQINQEEDFNSLLGDFHKFISILSTLTNTFYEKKIVLENWKIHLETHLVKFILCSYSLAYLLEGTPIKNKSVKFPDLPTIYLLRRSQIENYLMFYYLYIQPESQEEAEFKYFLFEASGLHNRQQYYVSTPENLKKRKVEKTKLDEWITNIQRNTYFQKITSEKKKKLLKQITAKTLTWTELIECSHLRSELFLSKWKLYSNHAHSEMIGLIQLKEFIQKPETIEQNIKDTLREAILPVCIIIKDLTKMNPILRDEFEKLEPHLINKINFWDKIGTKRS
jgi:hypothetical protein